MVSKKVSVSIASIIFLGTFCIGLTILPENVKAGTLYVGGSGQDNYTKIQLAVSDASPGDTVYVYSGTYAEDVSISKSLTLIGEDKYTTVIRGTGTADTVLITTGGVTIKGFTIKNSGSVDDEAGVRLFFVQNCQVTDSVLSGNSIGVTFRQSNNNLVRDNIFHANENGIHLWNSHFNVVDNNTVDNSTAGIELIETSNNTVSDNMLSDNRFGISISDSSYLILTNNQMIENGIFVKSGSLGHWNTHVIDPSNTVNGKPVRYWKNVTGGTILANAGEVILANCRDVLIDEQNVSDGSVGISIGHSSHITITDNNVSSNSYDGVYLYHSDNSTIIGNTVSSNRNNGFSLYSSHTNEIANNTASGNMKNGIYLYVSTGNSITGNDFLHNRQDGFSLEYSDGNSIVSNVATSNTENGGDLYYSDFNSINDNDVSNCGFGMSFRGANGNKIANNTAVDTGKGFDFFSSTHNVIRDNIATGTWAGIYLSLSVDNTLVGNYASSNNATYSLDSIVLWWSESNTLSDNVMLGNGLLVDGSILEYWNTHIIDSSNTVNGRPVRYWSNATGGTIPSDAGQVILANCANVVVENQNFGKGTLGVEIGFSTHSTVGNNTVSDSKYGIIVKYSDGNSLIGNTVASSRNGISLAYSDLNDIVDNGVTANKERGIELYYSDNNSIVSNEAWSNEHGIFLLDSDGNIIFDNNAISNKNGIYLTGSHDNRLYRNNIVDNARQGYDNRDTSQWDNDYPMGGNFWSDYVGTDSFSGPDQNLPGNDGIGDTPYLIDADTRDRYPLMSAPGISCPRPPTGLFATLSGTYFENVTLTWALSPDDGRGFRTVVGYQILRNRTYVSNGSGYGLVAFVPNGTSEFIDASVGEGDPNNYFYRVCAVDANDNASCADNQAGKFTRPLSKGLDILSVPLVQSDESIETVLQTVKWDKAWSFDSSSQDWRWHMKFKPYEGEYERMNLTEGLWVNVTESSNLTVAGVVPSTTTIHLDAGWNLVGFPSFRNDYFVADLKATIPLDRIEGYDATSPPYFLRLVPDGEGLQTGFGYWVDVSEEATWTIGDA